MDQPLFSSLDYFLMLAYILLVVGVGVWVGRGQRSTKEYFLAGRSMGWFPIGISTIASLYSAISYMGGPSEYRSYDLRLTVGIFSMIPTALVVMLVFMPFFHRLQVYTAYEYLEKRFNVTVRALASAVFVFWRILWMGTAVYVPSLVLHTITGFPLIPMILLVGRGGHALHGGGGNAGRDLDRRGPVFCAFGRFGAGPLGGGRSRRGT